MADRKPKVVVTRKLPEPVEARMGELFDAALNADDKPMDARALAAAVAGAEVLVPTITDRIDADLIGAAGPAFRMIANFGAGVDHIDVEAAHARGIVVTNTPGALTEDTADMAMALIMAVMRRLVEGAAVAEAGGYSGWSPTWMLGKRLKGAKLGIVGMGRIGQALARRARAFGLIVNYHNRKPVGAAIARQLEATYWESLDQMLAHMDIVSLNSPSTPATYHLLSARRLKLLPPHAVVINTSRGEVIDEAAMAEMLAGGELGGAGLDVFEHEPNINPRLLNRPNVVLLPHMSSATVEARIEMGEKVMINIRTYLDGHKPPDRVLPSML
jgi:glyoxylate reductase